GDDDYIGTSFDDTMRGSGGNDHLDGGAGDDTAIYAQSHDRYTLQDQGGGQLMVSGPEGSDVLTNFEHLPFADVTLDTSHLHVAQITSNGGGATASVSVAENTSAVTTVTAFELGNPAMTYSIEGGVDAAQFQIDGTTGALSFVVAPNFEAPNSYYGTNSYQ